MKRKDEILDFFLYWLVFSVGFFIRLLPVAFSLWLARMLGLAAYRFFGKRRAIGYVNIKAAYSERMSPSEIKKITARTFQHFAQVLFEMFRFSKIDKRYVDRYIDTESLSRIDDALKKGHGIIILTAHFGNWELSGLAGAIRGYPQDVLARQQKYARLNKLLNDYRAQYGRHVIEKGLATRGLIATLKANRIVAILSDQAAGMQGSLVNFFGRLASTPKGAAAFALKYDSVILPNFCARGKGAFYQLIIEKPLVIEKTGNIENDIQLILQRFTTVLESYIARYPNQWLWLHKRWKTTPSRRVLILNDGKAGHLNQARAVAKQIKRVVFERAEKDDRIKVLRASLRGVPKYGPNNLLHSGRRSNLLEDWEIASVAPSLACQDSLPGQAGLPRNDVDQLIYQEKIIDVKYKSRFHRAILMLCSLFASKACQGCMRCVRFCLTEQSYKNLMGVYADIVVSCGSQAAPLSRFLCQENSSCSIVVNRPSILPMSKFDLCIIPRHDRRKKLKNVLLTDGALNLIGEEYLRGRAKRLVQITENRAQSTEFLIGLLIGGDTKNFVLTKNTLEKILDSIVQIASNTKAAILATTSRRTSKDIEVLVKEKLGRLDNCKLLVIANEKNIPGVVAHILTSSNVVVVSGESVSMVSEAASSGKKVIVFMPALKNVGARHIRFLENLKEKGYIVLCEPADILNALEQVLKGTAPVRRLDDAALVYEAVKKLV